MISKLLVANRGEIAIRAFRAAVELDIATVAVHTWADRNSLHRTKADESYQIGPDDHPLRPYLDVDTVVAAALDARADAIYPGYGFLSENPDLARACERNSLVFVGPPSDVLALTGNKQRAHDAAVAAGIPTLQQSPEVTVGDAAMEHAQRIGFPLFVKAAAGGGGRGLRLVNSPEALFDAIGAAGREAEGAFGDSAVFLEQAVIDPRHIEVQVLGDAHGSVVHLYERDCSVQRRHQKVVEIAPAPNLDVELRDRMCADAVAFAESIGYCNAGTVEFLVDPVGRHVFIEMNPRIQVEHTVTEETTDVDLVHAQLRVASGATLAEAGLVQDQIQQRGSALQCRITTEDPTNDFRPDTGRIIAYRQPGGAGVRLDGGNGYTGADISPYFDSLLVKLTCRGGTFEAAVTRARRALAEFRIRGVTTNLGYLAAVLADPDFVAGRATTSFIDDRPALTTGVFGADRATKLLRYLGDVTVNRPHGGAPTLTDPASRLPDLVIVEPPAGSKQRLDELGPTNFATWLRASREPMVTDTTLRDAHQSLLATRVRTIDLVAGARHIAQLTPELLSLECWGGATFDAAIRFLKEDPWQRLHQLRQAAPNLCLQMLLRGRNTVGYTAYPDDVAHAFIHQAAATGVDIFRIFDAFNNIDQMRPAIGAVLETAAVAEGTICYTGDLSNPDESLYTLDYYLRCAEELVEAGVHMLAVKDMAGLLRPPAADRLVTALRERFDVPVVVHTHDTAGGQIATLLAAVGAGADAVDLAAAPMSAMTSQPSLPAFIAATDHTDTTTGLSMTDASMLDPYWEAVRQMYAPFENGLVAPTATVYHHEIPGGQLSNLRQQAVAVGLGERFGDIENAYAAVNRLFGNIIKVTPSSKVVGDLALQLVAGNTTVDELAADPSSIDLPDSVIGFLHGELGEPPAGWPEPFRTRALTGRRPKATQRALTEDDAEALGDDRARPTLNRLLFPTPTTDLDRHTEQFGDVSTIPTRLFLYGLEAGESDTPIDLEPGVQLLVGLDAIGEPDPRGIRTVMFELNGQLRPIDILDRSATREADAVEKADPTNPNHIAAPFTGVATPHVEEGDHVKSGDMIATIEAMKMETTISTPIDGIVRRLVISQASPIDAGDLLAELVDAGQTTKDRPVVGEPAVQDSRPSLEL